MKEMMTKVNALMSSHFTTFKIQSTKHCSTPSLIISTPPSSVPSGLGATFPSQIWTSLTNLQGVTLQQTSAYNSAAIGIVERFYRTLKATLMSYFMDSKWFTQFTCVIMQLRTPKNSLDVSKAEMVHGDQLVILAKLFPSTTSSDNLQCLDHVEIIYSRPPDLQDPSEGTYTDRSTLSNACFHCNYTSKPLLKPPFNGPILVIRRTQKAFLISIH
ncbi:uncharacterized protein [Palaemon carinicauda]|uniref:uncharacterized protein n=1 Tax=Palaemon carinicauda TaxID=392227 RepID=UPI0035B60D5F